MIDTRRGPVEVGLQALAFEHDPLDPVGEILELLPGCAPHQIAAHAAEKLRADVPVLVDPVAEAHHQPLGGELLVEPGLHAVGRADRPEHLEHLLVGAAMQWTLEGADGRRDRGMHVGPGRGDRAGREGRGVELVFRVEDERSAEGSDGCRGRPLAGEPGEQARCDAGIRPGGDGPTGGQVHPGGEDGGRLPEEPLRLGEEGGGRSGGVVPLHDAEHAHARAECIHRRGLRAARRQPRQGVDHRAVERRGGLPQPPGKSGMLGGGGQIAVEEQVGDLLEVTGPGEWLDVVAAVAERALEG